MLPFFWQMVVLASLMLRIVYNIFAFVGELLNFALMLAAEGFKKNSYVRRVWWGGIQEVLS